MSAEATGDADGVAHLREDEESFTGPRLRAIADCIAAFKAAAKTVRGAEARTRAALADIDRLREFNEEVARHLEDRSFRDLPGVRRDQYTLDALHQLTVGPWRGVFLVRPDGTEVIALVFSKHPHDLEQRLDEIAGRYRSVSDENAAGGGERDAR